MTANQKISKPECMLGGRRVGSCTKIQRKIGSALHLQLMSRTVFFLAVNLSLALSAIVWSSQLAQAEQCNQHGSDSEAVILAKRMLHNESTDLQFESARLETLAAHIEAVLDSLRAQSPKAAQVRARAHSNATVIVKVESALLDIISTDVALAHSMENLLTGFERFDMLNQKIGPKLQQVLRTLQTLVLCLDSAYDPIRVANAYAGARGVVYAQSDAPTGDGSDIFLAADAGQWLVVVSDRWGDCPSGCLNRHDSFFILSDSQVQELTPSEAERDSRFEQLLTSN